MDCGSDMVTTNGRSRVWVGQAGSDSVYTDTALFRSDVHTLFDHGYLSIDRGIACSSILASAGLRNGD